MRYGILSFSVGPHDCLAGRERDREDSASTTIVALDTGDVRSSPLFEPNRPSWRSQREDPTADGRGLQRLERHICRSRRDS